MPLPLRNTDESLTWLAAQSDRSTEDWHNECDGLQARAAGFAHSNEATAASHWDSLSRFGRRGPRAPWNPGDLLFWDGGAGHVVRAADDRSYCYTNDLAPDGTTDPVGKGRVHYTKISQVHASWGKPFLGSCPPRLAWPHASGATTLPPAGVHGWPAVSHAALRDARATRAPSGDVLTFQRGLILAGFLTLPKDRDGRPVGLGVFGPLTYSAWLRCIAAYGHGPSYALRLLGARKGFVKIR